MTHKLTYFDFAGSRGEECRLAFCLAGEAFEDHRIEMKQWPEIKPSTPFGALPMLEIEGEGLLAQSNAILTLIGRRYGVLPKDEFEAARHLAVMEACEELRGKVNPTSSLKDESEKKAAREALASGYLQEWGRQMNAQVKGPYLGGTNPSVADIKIYMILGWFKRGGLDYISPQIFDQLGQLNGVYDAMHAHPAIQSWQNR